MPVDQEKMREDLETIQPQVSEVVNAMFLGCKYLLSYRKEKRTIGVHLEAGRPLKLVMYFPLYISFSENPLALREISKITGDVADRFDLDVKYSPPAAYELTLK